MSTLLQDRNKNLLLTAEESRHLDEKTIKQLEIPGNTLMEVAGAKAADLIKAYREDGSLLFVCGKGNNAGDALVIARHCCEQFHCTIWLSAGRKDLSEDAGRNLKRLENLQKADDRAEISILEEGTSTDFDEYDLLIDGLLGTGLTSDVRSPMDETIRTMNRSGTPIVALDVPSGLHATTGEILGVSIQAAMTITFGYEKTGLLFGDGPEHSGIIEVADLGFPSGWTSSRRYAFHYGESELLLQPNSGRHKYDGGIVYVIGGSPGLTGAVIHAARSAWKTGVGAVVVIAPRGLMPVYDQALPGLVKRYVGSDEDYIIKEEHVDKILAAMDRPGGCLIGPGLGTESSTQIAFGQLVEQWEHSLVVDADGLRLLNVEMLKARGFPVLLTPHPGELKALVGQGWANEYNRLEAVEHWCRENKAVIISKGSPTCVIDQQISAIGNYSTSSFNRIGFGDLLSGAAAGFLSMYPHLPFESALSSLVLTGTWMEKAEQSSSKDSPPGPENLLDYA